MSCERVTLCFDLGEREPFRLECLPDYIDCALEVTMGVLHFDETLPEEAVALSRVLAGVPAPEFRDGSLGIFGYPVDQGLGQDRGLARAAAPPP